MSWSAPVIATTGMTVTAADWNVFADDLDVAAEYLPVFGVGTPAVGSSPPTPGAAPNVLLQAGTNSVTVASTGQGTLTLPKPFPNGVLGGWANPEGGSYTSVLIRSGASSASSLAVTAQPAAAGTLNILWGAVGW